MGMRYLCVMMPARVFSPEPIMVTRKKEDVPVQINLRISKALLDRVDTRIEKANEKRHWPKLTRSDLIRELLEKYVDDGQDAE
jgi:hypothetical protein